jgi:hypothetical protein
VHGQEKGNQCPSDQQKWHMKLRRSYPEGKAGDSMSPKHDLEMMLVSE